MANLGTISLQAAVDQLREKYGKPVHPPTSDLFDLILWENIAYLASPERKRKAFSKLVDSIGTHPEAILSADPHLLEKVAAFGILKSGTVTKLRQCARIASEDFGGDTDSILKALIPDARKLLQTFPSIAEPGAERILLFAGRLPSLAPESNGIRVLGRIGLIPEDGTYAKKYKLANALTFETRKGVKRFQEAHLLLQIHGKILCKRKDPKCGICPLQRECRYAKGTKRRA